MIDFVWINVARAMERLYHFCASDDLDAVRGRAECEAQYERLMGKDDSHIIIPPEPPSTVKPALIRIAIYILIASLVYILFGGRL